MQPRGVTAVATTASIAIELDHRQKILGRIVASLSLQHPRKPERDLKVGPAIDSVKVHRWGLDVIVDLQRVVGVGCPKQASAYNDRSIPQGEAAPVFSFCLVSQSLKNSFTTEYCRERQVFCTETATRQEKRKHE